MWGYHQVSQCTVISSLFTHQHLHELCLRLLASHECPHWVCVARALAWELNTGRYLMWIIRSLEASDSLACETACMVVWSSWGCGVISGRYRGCIGHLILSVNRLLHIDAEFSIALLTLPFSSQRLLHVWFSRILLVEHRHGQKLTYGIFSGHVVKIQSIYMFTGPVYQYILMQAPLPIESLLWC